MVEQGKRPQRTCVMASAASAREEEAASTSRQERKIQDERLEVSSKGGGPQLPDLSSRGQSLPSTSEKEKESSTLFVDSFRKNVGICVLDENTGMVFAARRCDDNTGAWQMPQGGIDKHEDPAVAALRELEEETGISPECVEIVGEVEDWLTYEFPTSVRTKIARRSKKIVFRGQTQKWFLLR